MPVPLTSQRRAVLTALGLAITVAWSPGATAAEFPGTKPIKLVVPFPPGGLTDSLARVLALGLSQELKGTVIVDNVPGAAGTLGVARVARAAPDGYTLVMGISATHAIAPALYKDLSYKPVQDFIPIGRAGQSALVVMANPQFPASNIQDMISLARKAQQPTIYAAWGVGTGGHLTMESIAHHAKVKMEQAPYKGESGILQALVGGEVLLGTGSVGAALPFVKAGRIKVLGVGGAQRSALLPDVPTLAEQGIPFKSSSWFGVFAPAKTPPQVTQELSRALAAVLARPQVIASMRGLGLDTETVSQEAFVRQIHEDTAAWAEVVKVSGARFE
ncbi:Tripartite tricarboxylate transporter family receptor [compost metagenome]